MITIGYGRNSLNQQGNTAHSDYTWLNGLEEYFHHLTQPDIDKFKDIRNSILYGNPYNMRNLIVNEVYRGPHELTDDFAKAITSYYLDQEAGNDRRVLQYISYSIDDEFIKTIARWSIKWHNTVDLNDHLSRGQIKSKMWMLKHLDKVLKKRSADGYPVDNIVHYGGWYATIAWFILRQHSEIKKYYNIETDPQCIQVADNFNQEFYNDNWRFKSIYHDVNDIMWEDRTFEIRTNNIKNDSIRLRIGPQLIINTSCEHMTDEWFYNLPPDMMVCLQTNDYFSNEQHINCVESVEAALEKYKFSRVYYSGELDTQLYNRFMIIGRT